MSEPIAFSPTVSGQNQNGVLVVMLDNPPVNATSVDLRHGLLAALRYLHANAKLSAMVLSGAGRTFVGGADIREFGKPPVEPTLAEVVETIEASEKPVVAAINGAALGGGAEIALACHVRLASPSARIGFPEVRLGIVPGAGATQRLPRLVAMELAIDLVATGGTVDAAAAHHMGLVDRLSGGDLIGEAVALAAAPETGFRRTSELDLAEFDAEKADAVAGRILARARGRKAPSEAIRLMRAAGSRPFAEGLADERATFLALRDSPEAAALRHVFFAERAAGRIEGLDGAKVLPVRSIAIIGLGLMGCGIAVAALDGGYKVIGIDQTEAAADAGSGRIKGLLERNLKSGRMDEGGLQDRLGRLTISSDLTAAAAADLVIEAVFDDLEVKSELFRKLDGIVRDDAILATNTSYLDPDVLAATTAHPARILGLHFFSPANVMRLLEVVRCARTAPDILATGLDVARRLGKLAVVTGVTEGFIGNSIFSAYRREAEFLLEDGALPADIDAAMEDYGFPMGPFAVFDMAGLEISWARRKRESANRDPSLRYVDIADRLCEADRFGQKSGRGWYVYPDGKRQSDPDVTALIEAARTAKHITARRIEPQEIVDRLLAAMALEGKALLERKIAARASDIDLVMINGYGFPAHKGGPMFAAGIGGDSA